MAKIDDFRKFSNFISNKIIYILVGLYILFISSLQVLHFIIATDLIVHGINPYDHSGNYIRLLHKAMQHHDYINIYETIKHNPSNVDISLSEDIKIALLTKPDQQVHGILFMTHWDKYPILPKEVERNLLFFIEANENTIDAKYIMEILSDLDLDQRMINTCVGKLSSSQSSDYEVNLIVHHDRYSLTISVTPNHDNSHHIL